MRSFPLTKFPKLCLDPCSLPWKSAWPTNIHYCVELFLLVRFWIDFSSIILLTCEARNKNVFPKLSDFADYFRLNLKCAHAKNRRSSCCCTQSQILQTKASNAVSPADAKLVVLLISRNATQTAKLVNLNILWKKTTKKKQIVGFLYSTRSEILRNISTKTEEEDVQDRNRQSWLHKIWNLFAKSPLKLRRIADICEDVCYRNKIAIACNNLQSTWFEQKILQKKERESSRQSAQLSIVIPV